jgi:hypothetical protein
MKNFILIILHNTIAIPLREILKTCRLGDMWSFGSLNIRNMTVAVPLV